MTAQVDLSGVLRERAGVAAQSWAPGVEVVDVAPLTGGASSLTFVATLRGVPDPHSRIVLKVAPPGLPPVRNRDVLRQGKLMNALHGRPGVRVPPVLFSDAAAPPFVAMGLMPGECVEPVLADERDPARLGEVRARALDAAKVLSAVHAVNPEQAGLGDEPVVTLGDEIDRWTRAFTTVPADLQHDYEDAARALHATMPAALPPVVNHGDYRLGNTLCEDGRVTAVIDWEIWSVGDPRVDLSWFAYFTDEAGHPGMRAPGPTGMPNIAELLAAYGQDLPDMRWFDALTRYKEAGATALLIKRGRKAGDLPPSMERMVPAMPIMLREAREWVS
ncbi:phosphotransferase family protein [Parafrankia sp. FMc2]|uniref:phosphotransferase family protein n=1 Tax=Parafrankia sp. FMc2 TaxID=3233196 RepID=UPI0034D5559E